MRSAGVECIVPALEDLVQCLVDAGGVRWMPGVRCTCPAARIVARWCEEHTGSEVNKRIFTDMFAEAWTKWTGPEKIIAAFRRVGLSVNGVSPEAIPKEKFVISSSVAKPPPALTMTTPLLETTAPQPTVMTRTAAASDALSSTTPLPAEKPKIDLSGEWEVPSPEGALERDSKEYWKAKFELASAAARELFGRAKQMYTTPLTLKESHPSWQLRKASPPKDDATRGRQRVKGEWGDMDSNQMLEKLDAEEEKEEERKEEAADKKRDIAERRAERELLEQQKKELKQQQREFEVPVTDLLKRLSFTEANKDECTQAELAAFARANRQELVALGVDLSNIILWPKHYFAPRE